MSRTLLVISALVLLTGCSELRLIGNAALRELKADGINVVQLAQDYHHNLEVRGKPGGELRVKIDGNRVVLVAEKQQVFKKFKQTKTKKVRGLWESASL